MINWILNITVIHSCGIPWTSSAGMPSTTGPWWIEAGHDVHGHRLGQKGGQEMYVIRIVRRILHTINHNFANIKYFKQQPAPHTSPRWTKHKYQFYIETSAPNGWANWTLPKEWFALDMPKVGIIIIITSCLSPLTISNPVLCGYRWHNLPPWSRPRCRSSILTHCTLIRLIHHIFLSFNRWQGRMPRWQRWTIAMQTSKRTWQILCWWHCIMGC